MVILILIINHNRSHDTAQLALRPQKIPIFSNIWQQFPKLCLTFPTVDIMYMHNFPKV